MVSGLNATLKKSRYTTGMGSGLGNWYMDSCSTILEAPFLGAYVLGCLGFWFLGAVLKNGRAILAPFFQHHSPLVSGG